MTELFFICHKFLKSLNIFHVFIMVCTGSVCVRIIKEQIIKRREKLCEGGIALNWQHLIYFKTIVEKDSFSKAAEELFITPSALSKAIRSLEEEAGFPLFEKRGRESVLTRYGEEFYPYVNDALGTLDNGLQKIQSDLGILKGKIRLSGVYTQCAEYIPKKIKQFKAEYPKINFELSYHVSGIIIQNVLNGKIDLGFCGDFDREAKDNQPLESVILSQEELILIAPKDHPLARSRYVDFSKLEGETFIGYRNNPAGLNEPLLRILEKNGVHVNFEYEVFDDYTVVQMVANGLGIGLIPENAFLHSSNVATLRFREDIPVRTLYMIWKKDSYLSAAASRFREFILEQPDMYL